MALTLDIDVGEQPVEPPGEPPVLVTEELHGGGHEQHADDRGVEEDRDGEADAHLPPEDRHRILT